MNTMKQLFMAVIFIVLSTFKVAQADEVRHPQTLEEARESTLLLTVKGADGMSKGLGSGWLADLTPWGLDGCYVITNDHVIDGKDVYTNRVYVTTHRNRASGGVMQDTQVGTVLYTDNREDIAIVSISSCEGLAKFKISTVAEVGDDVIALGAPQGLTRTVTKGVISNIYRATQNPDGHMQVLVQTDAPVNPGNSGGPLVNAETFYVVGMNVMIRLNSDGLAFSVRSVTIQQAVVDYLDLGHPSFPVFGFMSESLDVDLSKAYNVPWYTREVEGCNGRRIMNVVPGSVSDDAGFKAGDIILKANGACLDSLYDLQNLLSLINSLDVVSFHVWREGRLETVDIAVIPSETYVVPASPRVGPSEFARKYDGNLGMEFTQDAVAYPTDKVVVTQVYEFSEAFWAGALVTKKMIRKPNAFGSFSYEVDWSPTLKVPAYVRDGSKLVTTYQTVEDVRDTSGRRLSVVTPASIRQFADEAERMGEKIVFRMKVHVLSKSISTPNAEWQEVDTRETVVVFKLQPYEAP